LGLVTTECDERLHWSLRVGAASLAALVCLLSLWFLMVSQDIAELPCRDCNKYISCAPWEYSSGCFDPCQYAAEYHGIISGGGTVLEAEIVCPYGDIAEFTEIVDGVEIDWDGFCHSFCDL